MNLTLPRRRAWLATIIVAALPAAAAAIWAAEIPTGRTPGVAPARPAAPAAEANDDAGQYKVIVGKLASPQCQGRGPGTKGLDMAGDYLADILKTAGLRGAFEGEYFQPFDMRFGVDVTRRELAVAAAPGGKASKSFAPLGPDKDFSIMELSASGAFEGPAVFVGYSIAYAGKKYDSYAGAGASDLKGKVAVVLRYEPQDANGVSIWTKKADSWSKSASLTIKAALAARRGAVAVLVVNPPAGDNDKLDPPATTGRGRKASIPVLHITRKAWLGMLKEAGRDAGQSDRKLRQGADEGTGGPVRLDLNVRGHVEVKQGVVKSRNIAAVLPGAGALADEYVIVGAHYDHIGSGLFGSRRPKPGGELHPGADDNASGTAGVMTLARRLAERESDAAPGRPASRRTIVLAAFAGEELGLLGSSHMVKNWADMGIRNEQVVAMVNMDMIGRLNGGRLKIWGVDSADGMRELVDDCSRGLAFELSLVGSGTGPSDHSTFYKSGMPVLGFHTGANADMHCPTDTADKINVAGAIRVLRLVEMVVDRLATDEKRLAHKPAPSRPPGRGAFLGISGDADYEGGGRVDSVISGSPAATAGLAEGDVIIKWDGKDVKDLASLLGYLRKAKPGQSVKATIRREGKTRELDVKLGGPKR